MVDRLLLRPTEAAEALGVSRAHIYRMIRASLVPTVRLGAGVVRVPVKELSDLIETLADETANASGATSTAAPRPPNKQIEG